MKGTAALVGAGPGDPELLTIKAKRFLEEADVVIHDALVTPALLSLINPKARLIFMGKRGGKNGPSQDQVNRRLVAEARSGLKVVRLKGGDPFVFGRGGEEALALARAGIPFQVVPGVTSALAAPAYAGIPLTHRGKASAVTFLTARQGEGEDEVGYDLAAVAKSRATLVFLMGVGRMERLLKDLGRAGVGPNTPAAAVSWGSTALQKSILATVGTLAKRCAAESLRSPAAIVVGSVAALHKKLAWFENLPLFGKTILVTRSLRRSGRLSSLLKGQGAEVFSFPLLDSKPLPLNSLDKRALARPGEFDLVAFTSPEAVRIYFETLKRLGGDARALAGTRLAVVGPGTASELHEHGLKPDYEAKRHFRAQGLLEFLPPLKGKSVLLPRARGAREILTDGLRKAGAEVRSVALYETVLPSSSRRDVERLQNLLRDRTISAITFTSSSSVSNLIQALGHSAKPLIRQAKLISIGPSTSASLREAGLRVDAQAEESTVEGLVTATARALRKKVR